MIPPLSSVDNLEVRLGTMSACQRARASAVLDDISAEVRAATNRRWLLADGSLDPCRPEILAVVTLRAAERVMRNPANLAAETVGDYTRRFPDRDQNDDGIYLTEGERRMLDAAVTALTGGPGGLVSVPTVRDVRLGGRGDPASTVYLRDQYGGDPLAWLAADEFGTEASR